jgi:hypothetical protein
MLDLINSVVDDDAQSTAGSVVSTAQLALCIKPGVSKFLDEARRQFNDLTVRLQEQVRTTAPRYYPVRNALTALSLQLHILYSTQS